MARCRRYASLESFGPRFVRVAAGPSAWATLVPVPFVAFVAGPSVAFGAAGRVPCSRAAWASIALATVCSLLGVRGTLRSLAGHGPGAESSVAKLLGVRNRQDGAELVVSLHGDAVLLDASDDVRADVWEMLNTRCLSIAGGTTQILRNVAGERILGLPR